MRPRIIVGVAAAALVSLGFVGNANAQFFGGRSSVSVTRTFDDGFGDRRSVTRRISDNGFTRCRSITRRASDGFGDRTSRTVRQCASDF
jgi:hypothetical protein